jgi:tocopherol O-methyltransferase
VIVPGATATAAGVADHYDELDVAYRRIWGDHVHHGYWRSGRESPAEAVEALVGVVEERLDLQPGQDVCDIGCGYGATAAALAARRGVSVLGLTVSAAQERIARARAVPGFTCRRADWLDNGLPDAAFDAAIAIESLSHMPDKPRVFGELARVVRPGGRVVIVDWLAAEHPSTAARRLLLDPICREGRLPALHAVSEYEAFLRAAGLSVVGSDDLSRRAARTWTVVARRLPGVLARDPRLLARAWPERAFLPSLARIPIALRTGAMRLVLLVAERSR